MNCRPAVILPTLYDIDFVTTTWSIKARRTMLCLKHQVSSRLPIHTLRITMTNGPDFRTRVALTNKRVIGWNCSVIIQSQCFAGQRIEFLRQWSFSRVSSSYVKIGRASCRERVEE